MDNQSRIKKRLDSSYCPVPRQEILRVFEQSLSAPAFQLYMLVRFCAVDWKESEDLGLVKITLREVKDFFGWSLDKTQTYFNKLKEKKLLLLKKAGVWRISLDGAPCSDEAEQNSHRHNNVKNEYKAFHDKTEHRVPIDQNTSVPIGQNNLTSNTGNLIRKEKELRKKGFMKSDEEYELIWNEMGSPLDFTIDDMKWIDQNIF